jgi:putative aldouronate transport system substrate-binding protein
VYNIFLSFMDPNLSFRERWVNTVAERQLLVPGVKEAYRFLNRMYNDGLIDRDFPLYADDTAPSNVMKSGIVGAFQHNWDQPFRQNLQIQTEIEKNIPGAKFVPVDCFTNSAGLTPKRGSPASGGLIMFVPKTAKNPEAVMRYANWLCRYENYHFLQFGTEGVNHEMVDGVPRPINATGPWIQNSGANVDYTMPINGYLMRTSEELSKVLAFGYPGIPAGDVTAAYTIASTNARQEPYVPATITSLSAIRQVLVERERTLSVNLICARPGEFDQVWDAGTKDWLTAGAQTVIDEQRAKYRQF